MAGDIKLGVDFDTSEAEKSIKELQKMVEETSSKIDGVKSKIKETQKSIDNNTNAQSQYNKKLEETQNKVNSETKSQNQLNEKIKETKEIKGELLSTDKKVNEENSKAKNNVEQQTKSYSQLVAEVEKLKAEQDRLINQQTTLKQQLASIKLNPSSFKEVEEDSYSIKNIWNSFKGATTKVASSLSKISGLALGVLKTSGKMLLKFTGVQAVANGIRGAFQRMIAPLSTVLSRTIGLAKRVFVFTMITRALRKIKTVMTDLWGTDKDMVNYWATIKGNIYTAFAPFYDWVMPIIKQIMQGLVNVTAYIARVSATLFGQTAKQAQSNAKALYNQKNATDKLKKSTDKATKSLAGFDTAQVLAKEKADSTSDSADSGSGAISPIWNLAKVDTSGIDKFIKELKKRIKKGDWEGVGSLVAKKLSEQLRKIKWNKINKVCKSVADKIGRTINGFVKDFDWNLLGKTIGNAISTIALTLDTFALRVNWRKIGSALSKSLNGFNRVLSSGLIGKTLADIINAGIRFAEGFAYTFNWTLFGETLANNLKKFISTIDLSTAGRTLGKLIEGVSVTAQTFFDGTNWDKLGEKLRKGLTNFFNSNPLGNIVSIVKNAFTSLFKTGISLLGENGELVSSLGKTVGKAINEFFGDKNFWGKAGEFLSTAIVNLTKFFTNAIKNIDVDKVTSAFVEFFKNIDWEVIGLNLYSLLKALITKVWESAFSPNAGIAAELKFRGLDFSKDVKTYSRSKSGKIVEDASVGTEGYAKQYAKIMETIGEKAKKIYRQKGITGLESLLETDPETLKKLSEKYGQKVGKIFKENGIDGIVEYLANYSEGGRSGGGGNIGEVVWTNVVNGVKNSAKDKNNIKNLEEVGKFTAKTIKSGANGEKTGEKIANDTVKGAKVTLTNENSKKQMQNAIDNLTNSKNYNIDASNVGKKIVNSIKEGMKQVDVVKELRNTVEGILSGDINIITNFAKKTKATKGKISTSFVNIPKYATGTVLPPNMPHLAIVGDQKHGTNVEAPLETIKQALREVQGSQTINIKFTGTMSQLVRALQPEIEREERRTTVWR